jgi:pyruvate/2-oxoglutarate dehydrogenase complex dihydrolipoamide acyltransferase (E2) component
VRIVEGDVLIALDTARLSQPTLVAEMATKKLSVDLPSIHVTGPWGCITRSHKRIVERMTASFHSAPHFYLHSTVQLDGRWGVKRWHGLESFRPYEKQ